MVHSDQGIVRNQRGEEQPVDKHRAQTAPKTGPQAADAGSPSREATRDPKLTDDSKTPGSGMAPDDSDGAPSG